MGGIPVVVGPQPDLVHAVGGQIHSRPSVWRLLWVILDIKALKGREDRYYLILSSKHDHNADTQGHGDCSHDLPVHEAIFGDFEKPSLAILAALPNFVGNPASSRDPENAPSDPSCAHSLRPRRTAVADRRRAGQPHHQRHLTVRSF